VASKLQTVARFKGIKQMWIGADFSNTSSAWQWRGYYKSFNGKSIHLFFKLRQFNFLLDFTSNFKVILQSLEQLNSIKWVHQRQLIFDNNLGLIS
jgi:hypothetical protein